MHNQKAQRLKNDLTQMGIQPELICAYFQLTNQSLPKPKNLKEAIHFKILSIQAERFALLLAP